MFLTKSIFLRTKFFNRRKGDVKMRKRTLEKIFLLVLLLLIFAFTITINASERKVVIYCGVAPYMWEPLFKEFTAETGIQVEYVMGGTGELWSRVRAEKERPFADLLQVGSVKMFEAAKEENIFQFYESPEDANYPFVDSDHIWHGFAFPGGLQSMMVNTNLIDPKDYPASWHDLADIKYNGMIAILNPTYSGTGYNFAQLLIHLAQTQWEYEDGWDFLKKVMMNSKIYVSTGASRNAVRDGEIAMGYAQEGPYAMMIEDEFPVHLCLMEEGYTVGIDAIGMIKGGPNPEEAKEFIDFFLGKEAQQILVDATGSRPMREDVEMPEYLAKHGLGDDYMYITLPDYLFEEPDNFKKKWNEAMGEAIAIKNLRDKSYNRIEAAELTIETTKEKGRTVGLKQAEDKLADAIAAFNLDKYKEAEIMAADALKLAVEASSP